MLLIELETGDLECGACGALLRARSTGEVRDADPWMSLGRSVAPQTWHYESAHPKKTDRRIIDTALCAACAPPAPRKSGMHPASWRWI